MLLVSRVTHTRLLSFGLPCWISGKTAHNQGLKNQGGGGGDRDDIMSGDKDLIEIAQGTIIYDDSNDITSFSFPYYHCGSLPTNENSQLSELVLLHGVALRKEDWKGRRHLLDMLLGKYYIEAQGWTVEHNILYQDKKSNNNEDWGGYQLLHCIFLWVRMENNYWDRRLMHLFQVM